MKRETHGVIGDIVTVAPILREKLDDSLSIASDQELVLPGGEQYH